MQNINNCQVLAYKKISHSGLDFCKLLANVKQENLTELVQRRLKELGLKKSHLAEKTGLSRTYITDIANGTGNTQSGQYRPSPEVISSLSKHLQVSEIEILNAIGYSSESKQQSIPKPILEAIGKQGEISDRNANLIANFIDMLGKQEKETEN